MNAPLTQPLGIYVHWPFCLTKCPYCDFNSHVRQGVDHMRWLEALLADLRWEATTVAGSATSLFFGGGTPSLMPPHLVEALIAEVHLLWPPDQSLEITLEANPSSVEAANFAELAQAGVNRVSLGVQSLDPAALALLGRAHGVEEALRAVDVAQAAFERVSLDLIYARPDQTLEAWMPELERALALGTEHMSLYQLTIEPGTRFATLVREGALTPLDADAAADQFESTRERMTAAGMPAYEVSNHARAGCESRHNLTYWRYGNYVGVGPGAHGRRGGVATERHRKPENWLAAVARNGHGLQREDALAPEAQAREALVMGLRLAEGVDMAHLAQRTAVAGDRLVNRAKVQLFERQGLVVTSGQRLTVTPAGMLLLDGLLGELVEI